MPYQKSNDNECISGGVSGIERNETPTSGVRGSQTREGEVPIEPGSEHKLLQPMALRNRKNHGAAYCASAQGYVRIDALATWKLTNQFSHSLHLRRERTLHKSHCGDSGMPSSATSCTAAGSAAAASIQRHVPTTPENT
jgi:hypothetical protein